MKHVEQTKSGSWQYRRRVPKDVSEVITKREFKRKLGDSQKEALAAYPQYHAQVERVIDAAKKRIAGAVAASGPGASEREAYAEALRRRADLVAKGATADVLEIAADSLADSFPQEGYEPVGAPPVDRHTVNLLRLGPGRYSPPEPTLGDALRLYLKEHLKADSPETDSRVTGLATRVVEAAIAAVGRDPLLTAITREEARAVRDHMLDSAASRAVCMAAICSRLRWCSRAIWSRRSPAVARRAFRVAASGVVMVAMVGVPFGWLVCPDLSDVPQIYEIKL